MEWISVREFVERTGRDEIIELMFTMKEDSVVRFGRYVSRPWRDNYFDTADDYMIDLESVDMVSAVP